MSCSFSVPYNFTLNSLYFHSKYDLSIIFKYTFYKTNAGLWKSHASSTRHPSCLNLFWIIIKTGVKKPKYSWIIHLKIFPQIIFCIRSWNHYKNPGQFFIFDITMAARPSRLCNEHLFFFKDNWRTDKTMSQKLLTMLSHTNHHAPFVLQSWECAQIFVH